MISAKAHGTASASTARFDELAVRQPDGRSGGDRPWGRTIGRARVASGLLAICLASSGAQGQTFFPWLVDVGYADLVARLGGLANTPKATSIGLGQVEVSDVNGNYGPNQSHVELVGKTFYAMSGPPGNINHATDVAKYGYGKTWSCAPGIAEAWLYEATSWVQGAYLRVGFGSSTPPLVPPANLRLFNNSWVAASTPAFNNEILRRADFAIRRDNTPHISGMNNSGGDYQPLMAGGYNGVLVGIASGAHVSGPTPGGIDGPGRQKPEIVAPTTFTSFATPIVSGIVALLLDTVALDPELSLNPNAKHSAVIKAVLLAGAVHRPGWTNNPATGGPNRGVTSTPLDSVYGVDLANVNRSHLILTSGEFDGGSTFDDVPEMPETGWDLVSVANGESRWYVFTLYAPAEHFSVVATWHRVVASNFTSFTLANFDLRLWRVTNDGSLASLVGDGGLPWFDSGNVVSQSTNNNLEHLYVRSLQPGTYALEVDRIDTSVLGVPVAVAWIRPEDPGPPALVGDLNGDGLVDGADLGLLLAAFETSGPVGDLNGDGFVDGSDLGLLLAAWFEG